mmetsp:Transcript_10576/g.39393  ORF Transcript_10576/g.39393 Transcript_10576/m.39393 type:complete len:328 (-) Transcript_10576:73-1056(-)
MGQKLSSNQSKNRQSSGLAATNASRHQKAQEHVHAKFTWKDANNEHQHVSLVASFNSWEPIPLKFHEPTKEWLVILTIPAGRHLYRYIVNGEYRYDTGRKYIVDKDGKCSNLVNFQGPTSHDSGTERGRSSPVSVLHQNPQYRTMMQQDEEYFHNGSKVSTRSRSRSGPPRPHRVRASSGADSKTNGEIPVRFNRHRSPIIQKSKSHERLRPSDPENPEQNLFGQEEYVFPVKRKYPPLLPPHTSYTLLNIRPDDPINLSPRKGAKRHLDFHQVRWDDVEPLHVTLNHIYFARSKDDNLEERDLVEMGLSTKYRGKSTTIHIFACKK